VERIGRRRGLKEDAQRGRHHNAIKAETTRSRSCKAGHDRRGEGFYDSWTSGDEDDYGRGRQGGKRKILPRLKPDHRKRDAHSLTTCPKMSKALAEGEEVEERVEKIATIRA